MKSNYESLTVTLIKTCISLASLPMQHLQWLLTQASWDPPRIQPSIKVFICWECPSPSVASPHRSSQTMNTSPSAAATLLSASHLRFPHHRGWHHCEKVWREGSEQLLVRGRTSFRAEGALSRQPWEAPSVRGENAEGACIQGCCQASRAAEVVRACSSVCTHRSVYAHSSSWKQWCTYSSSVARKSCHLHHPLEREWGLQLWGSVPCI